MIKLVCNECMSDNICFLETKNTTEWFYCEDCGKEFGLFESDWREEE